MKRAILFLGLALIVQLALALGLRLEGNSGKATATGGKLLTVSAEQVDAVHIEGSDGEAVLLRKTNGKWHLPEHFDVPADQVKVDNFLHSLLAIERSWPVAKTAEAIKRFQVADKNFERRLRFMAGDRELAVLLLGTSPGFRKVHARLAGEEEVFDIPFSSYQAGIKDSDWVDKQQLWVDGESVSAIELPDCRLNRSGGKWVLTNPGENEETDTEKARQLLRRLTQLNIQDVYSGADTALPGSAELSIALELTGGESRRYDFVKIDDQGHALLKVSGKPFLYRIGTAIMKDLKETTREKLVKAKDAPAPRPTESEKVEGKT